MAINNINNVKPVVLVVPLDWGLGHATRCIPIINECLQADFEVVIAAERNQKALLQSEFPGIKIFDLKGYRLHYASNKWLTILKLILQIPKILIAINREKKWFRNFIKEKHVDIIISDNRFGLYKAGIISIFITHQLNIKTPFGKIIDKIIQRINYYFINRFNYCWVPDTEDEKNLGGELSHPFVKPLCNMRYIGILSRIKKEQTLIKNKLLILLSGPEPQRSIFEKKLLLQLKEFFISAVFIRGLPASSNEIYSIATLKIFNHVSGDHLQQIINESEIVISRSGYTTIMEVLPLNKKCIFFPTPGQTEQEYLAKYLADKGWCNIASQNNFSLPALIKEAEKKEFPNLSFFSDADNLKDAINELRDKLETNKTTIHL